MFLHFVQASAKSCKALIEGIEKRKCVENHHHRVDHILNKVVHS